MILPTWLKHMLLYGTSGSIHLYRELLVLTIRSTTGPWIKTLSTCANRKEKLVPMILSMFMKKSTYRQMYQ